jgi:hypothetical protein
MNTMNIPGFTAEAALFVTRESSRMVSVNDHSKLEGQVLPQLGISLGCRRTGICSKECCWMEIRSSFPYTRTTCWTQHNPDCSLGDLFFK